MHELWLGFSHIREVRASPKWRGETPPKSRPSPTCLVLGLGVESTSREGLGVATTYPVTRWGGDLSQRGNFTPGRGVHSPSRRPEAEKARRGLHVGLGH